MMMALKCLI